jgi:hypothetical protein
MKESNEANFESTKEAAVSKGQLWESAALGDFEQTKGIVTAKPSIIDEQDEVNCFGVLLLTQVVWMDCFALGSLQRTFRYCQSLDRCWSLPKTSRFCSFLLIDFLF